MLQVLGITLPLVAVAAIGFSGARAGLLSAEVVAGLGRLVFVVEIPAVLFRSLAGQDFRGGIDVRINLAYSGGCLLVFAASLLIGSRVLGLRRSEAGVFGLSAAYSNSSLLGIPVIQAAFGAPGLVLLGRIIAFHSLLLLPVATLIVVLGRETRHGLWSALGRSVRTILCSPVIIGLLAGVAWSLTGLGLAPAVERVLALLSDAATPTALLALGGMQRGVRLDLLGSAGTSVGLKLLLHPVLVYLLATSIGGLSHDAIAVATLTAALPAGMNVFLMAQRYDCYLAEATAATSLGTLLSLITIAGTLGAVLVL